MCRTASCAACALNELRCKQVRSACASLLRCAAQFLICLTVLCLPARRYMTGEANTRPGAMLNLMKDQYGNYVVQRALEASY